MTDTRVLPDDGESPIHPRSSPPAVCDGGTADVPIDPDDVCARLEVIDEQVRTVLESVGGLDQPHDAVRHLREIRAEVAWARRLLCVPVSADDPADDSDDAIDDSSDSTDDSRSDSSAPTDDPNDDSANDDDSRDDAADDSVGNGSEPVTDDVPMVVERGPFVTTVLGPDPVVYEHMRERVDEQREDRDRDSKQDVDQERDQGLDSDQERDQEQDQETAQGQNQEQDLERGQDLESTQSNDAHPNEAHPDDDQHGGDRDDS